MSSASDTDDVVSLVEMCCHRNNKLPPPPRSSRDKVCPKRMKLDSAVSELALDVRSSGGGGVKVESTLGLLQLYLGVHSPKIAVSLIKEKRL